VNVAAPVGRLAVNAGSMMIGRMGMAALSWAGTVLVARQLGQERFGQFTLVFSLLGMLSVVTDLGLGRVAVTGLARAGEDRAEFAGSYLVLRGLLGLVGYGTAMAVVTLSGYPPRVVSATAVGGLVVILATPSHAYDVAFQLRDRLPSLALAGVVAQAAQVALTVALVLHGGSVVWFTVPAVLYEVIILVWKVPTAHRLIPISYRVRPRVWRALLREAAPLTVGAAFVTLYYRVDSLMLASLDGFTAVGLYGVAYKFVDLVHFVPTALTVALIAPLSRSWIADRPAFTEQLREGFRMLALGAVAAVVGFSLFATDLAGLFYGAEYAPAGHAVRTLIAAETIGFFSTLAITALLATGGHRRYPLITLLGLVVNVSANLVVIPRWSYEGAALTTLLTEAIVGVLLWRVLRRSVPEPLADRRLLLSLLATGALAALVGVLVGLAGSWLLAAGASALTFLVAVDRFRLTGPGGLRSLAGTGRRSH
jgi:O-antigen/teichoic acid export membrane protein